MFLTASPNFHSVKSDRLSEHKPDNKGKFSLQYQNSTKIGLFFLFLIFPFSAQNLSAQHINRHLMKIRF